MINLNFKHDITGFEPLNNKYLSADEFDKLMENIIDLVGKDGNSQKGTEIIVFDNKLAIRKNGTTIYVKEKGNEGSYDLDYLVMSYQLLNAQEEVD